MSDDSHKNIVRRVEPDPPQPRVLRLGQQEQLDLSHLDEKTAKEIEVAAHRKTIDRDHHRQSLQTDLAATSAKLGLFAKTVSETSQENASVTITNTTDDSLGRTEIIVGNTDAARSGKLTRSQSGLPENTRVWLILAAIAAAVIVLVAALNR